MTKTAMADGGLSSISAGVEHGRARGGMEELRGEVAQLGARWIEAGWRWMVGANAGAASGGARVARLR